MTRDPIEKRIESAIQYLFEHDKRITVEAVQAVLKKRGLHMAPAAIKRVLDKRVEDYIRSIS